jgi:stage II sporulation protein D
MKSIFFLRIHIKKNIYYTAILFAFLVILPFLIVSPFKALDIINELIPNQPSKTIKVYDYITKKINTMDIEDYLEGVVAAEMPVDFEEEALKAQAVAARTFAFGRLTKDYSAREGSHPDADVCTDPGCCQAWISKEKISEKWSDDKKASNWARIERAVSETRNIIITYDGAIINPLYHSNSGGYTENIEEVWAGAAVPYLKSVVSEGEDVTSEYETSFNISVNDFKSKFKDKYPDIKFSKKNIIDDININSLTTGKRVNEIKIGDITMKGTDVRTVLSLRSAAFEFAKVDDLTIKVTTRGDGHGVGMSQWGADAMAKKGSYYQQILLYYYKDIDFSTIDHFKM